MIYSSKCLVLTAAVTKEEEVSVFWSWARTRNSKFLTNESITWARIIAMTRFHWNCPVSCCKFRVKAVSRWWDVSSWLNFVDHIISLPHKDLFIFFFSCESEGELLWHEDVHGQVVVAKRWKSVPVGTILDLSIFVYSSSLAVATTTMSHAS